MPEQPTTPVLSKAAQAALDAAAAAGPVAADLDPSDRARALRELSGRLRDASAQLVETAQHETSLSAERLVGELDRTRRQLDLFADLVGTSRQWLDLRVDPAAPGPPATPEIVRFNVAMGPALVFTASNFPFAFGVLGTDTAAAMAAGCPVVVKTHPGHPRTSEALGELVDGLDEATWPAGGIALVSSQEDGVAALLDPRIRVAAFTGSLAAGRQLFTLASNRPDPLPFYAEMGSVNPVFVTPAAAESRADEIADGYVASFSMGVGQFCTKPGIILVPAHSEVPAAIAERVRAVPAGTMLTERVRAGHDAVRDRLTADDATTVLGFGEPAAAGRVVAQVLAVDIASVLADPERFLDECFGPTSIVITYDDLSQAEEFARVMPGSLTATVQRAADEDPPPALLRLLRDRVGRLVVDGWPTGLVVGDATQHGGPYPATTHPGVTSVGTAAISRFLRPVAYQNAPRSALPPHIRRYLADRPGVTGRGT